MQKNPENNPTFKTELCRNYMVGFFCEFADQCQFAHGKHELREKPTLDPSSLDDEAKEKMIRRNQQRPDYKTKICKNFEESDFCDYGELCNFAHGAAELREPKVTDATMNAGPSKKAKKPRAHRLSMP